MGIGPATGSKESGNREQYWAALPPKDCVSVCEDRTKEYYQHINALGYKFVWSLVYLFKHSATERQPLASAVGEYGELQQVRVNDFRNLLQHKAGIIKNQRAVWEPMAINTDVKSLAQTKIAKAVIEAYTTQKGYDHKLNIAVDYLCSYGESFLLQLWDATKGKLTHTLPHPTDKKNEDGTPKVVNFYEGDVDCREYEPINVIRDVHVDNFDANKWFIFRDRKNKWDLAAKHPELYHEIIKQSFEFDFSESYTEVMPLQRSDDLLNVYTFVHMKTPACPSGRIIEYINEDLILQSTELNYEDVPWHRMYESSIPGKNFAYCDAFDLLQVADLCDGYYSTIVTNHRAFALQNIIMPKGSGISETVLFGAMNLIEFDPASGGKPEALNLLATPPEVFNMLNIFEQKKNTIAGVNSTIQGNPPNDVSSGVAISMMQSLNVQYNQGAQESYVKVLSSLGTALINILKQNAKTERLLAIVGSSKRSLLEKFTGHDLDAIARVVAKPGNPMTQTIQGRFTIAEMLLQAGIIHDTEELLTVLETGSLDVMTDGALEQQIYAQQENEELRKGEVMQAHPFDNHKEHIQKHIALISDIAVRSGKIVSKTDPTTGKVQTSIDPNSNPEGQAVLNAVNAHIMEHLQYIQDPKLLPLFTALGYMSEAAPQGPPQMPGKGGSTTVNMGNKVSVSGTKAGAGPSPAAGTTPPPASAGAAGQGPQTGMVPQSTINSAMGTGAQ